MTFFGYDNRVIRGPLEYINHKDVVFNAFFRIDRIQQLRRRRKLVFAHHLHLLLGNVLNEREKDNETLRQEIDALLGNTNRLSKQLKNRFKEFSHQGFSLQIKTAKQGWKPPLHLEPEVAVVQGSDSEEEADTQIADIVRNIQAHIRHPHADNDKELIITARNGIKAYIDGLKADRSRLFLAIQQFKSELADQRYQLYIRRRTSNLTKRDQKAPRQTRVLQQITGQPTIAKAEDMQLMGDADNIAKNFTFPCTDNGVVKMTESVPVSIQRYTYHLKLYNRFSALTTTEEQEEEFQPLPSSTVINAEDIDFGSQNLNYRHKLAAKMLFEKSIFNASSVEAIQTNYHFLQANRQTVRNFCDSSQRSKQAMKQEYFTKKIRDRLCSREREFANPKLKKKDVKKKGKETQRKNLLMMIGDHGFGIGSRVKRHLRYGGIWKQDLHARYMTVCITNENYTSQTCAFHCLNPECPSVKNGRGVSGRDKLSALAIAISEITTLLFQQTLRAFSRTISHSNTEFNHKTSSFCTRSGVLAARET
ncbi:hypothetical protein BD560DRAFT_446568 [Blakeslea trispora]|nr:hypothetical protein BD560DRAFT_446568 [Blakeslea trispora]